MIDRRDLLRLGACGAGAVFVNALAGCAARPGGTRDFYFVQLSDAHWGYEGPANPDAAVTLPKAVASVNALPEPPDFIVFTGDLTHTTDDATERRRRMAGFKTIVKDLNVKTVHFMPGEHDAGLDGGEAFREAFGPTHYTFTHDGVQFIVLDNVSQPGSTLGDAQLQWLQAQLAPLKKDAPLVVFTHRPLFDLAPQWDWATRDGARAIELLMPFEHVTVFYGHIHQAHHHRTAHIEHHAARSLIFALPAPGSQPQRTPLLWDPAVPYKGLGWREVEAETAAARFTLAELPVVRS
jgi:hypothetical protein